MSTFMAIDKLANSNRMSPRPPKRQSRILASSAISRFYGVLNGLSKKSESIVSSISVLIKFITVKL